MKNLISIVTGLALTGLLLGAPRAAAQTATLGTTNLVEGPAAGTDSVVLGVTPAAAPWTASPNTSWLHLAAGQQSGIGSTNVIFTFDANPGATRAGTLTVAGQSLTVTQAGATYVAANPFTTLVSSGLNNPLAVTVDGAGNVYIADYSNNAIKEWSIVNGAVTKLAVPTNPRGVAVDGAGNVYFSGVASIREWPVSTHSIIALVSGLNGPGGVAVDQAGNVYFADSANNAIKEWSPASATVTTLISAGLNNPFGVAVDGAGNLYIADAGDNAIKEWSAVTHAVTPLVATGLANPTGVAVDGSGNVYIADSGNNAIKEWLAAGSAVTTLVSSNSLTPLSRPEGVAVDTTGNLYVADTGNNAVKELVRALVDPTPIGESAAVGNDALPPVLPATEDLTGPFSPASNQPWLTIGGITNGVVSYGFQDNSFGLARTAYITLLGVTIPITQAGNGPNQLGTTTLTEAPTAGTDSVVVADYSPDPAWTATANATWLHLAASQTSGTVSTNVIFTFDANLGATRTGTLSIAGLTLTVTQAGATYVAANPLTTLVSSGLFGTNGYPYGVAVDGAGNVYVADYGNSAIEKWSLASGAFTTLVSSNTFAPWGYPLSLAVDTAGNVYIADPGNNAIEEWSPASGMFTTLVSSGYPAGVAVDGVGNVYVADSGNDTVEELPRAFVDTTPKVELATAGSELLPAVLPTTENLAGDFAPASDSPWLTITGVTNGVVSYAFTANPTLVPRTAHLTVLGLTIPVTQPGNGPLLTGSTILSGGNFQFTFTGTAGASYSVWFTTNLALPFSAWTAAGSATLTTPGQFQFTATPTPGTPAGYYRVTSP